MKLNSRKNRGWTAALLGCAIAAATAGRSLADSLLTIDNQYLSGKITKTEDGYLVKTNDGNTITVSNNQVKRVMMDSGGSISGPGIVSLGTAGTGAGGPGTAISGSSPGGAHSRKLDPKMRDTLLHQAQDAYNAGLFADARDVFADTWQVDPNCLEAARGLGFSYLKLTQPRKAAKPLALVVEKTRTPDRALALGASAAFMGDGNPMRAAKLLNEFLTAHSSPLDEPVINALGTALNQASSTTAARSPLYQTAAGTYAKLNGKLEAQQSGKKRWGITWEDAGTVEKRWKARDEAQAKVNNARAKVNSLNGQINQNQSELSNAGLSGGNLAARNARVANLQSTVTRLQGDLAAAQTELDQAISDFKDTPAPDYPEAITLAEADLPLDPNGASAGTLASAVTPGTPSAVPTAGAVTPSDSSVTSDAANASDKTITSNDTTPVAPANPQHKHTVKPKPVPTDTDNTETSPPVAPVKTTHHITRSAVAFAISSDLVITTADCVEGSSDVHAEMLDGSTLSATVVRTDSATGLALVKLSSGKLSGLALAASAKNGGLTAWGFPEPNIFSPVLQAMSCSGAPADSSWTLKFQVSPRLSGGPILQNGAVVGVEMGTRDSDPAAVPAISIEALKQFIGTDPADGKANTDPKLSVVQLVAEKEI